MAKKFKFKPGVNVIAMSEALKREKIEHVAVLVYPTGKYIVVKNIYKDIVHKVCGNDNILSVKNVRHYENICIDHIDDYYDPEYKLRSFPSLP